MQASVYDIHELSPAQIARWNQLLAAMPIPSPFLSYAFCRAVHDVRGEVRVLQISTDGGLTGFLPFQIRQGRRFLGHAKKAGGSFSDMFGIVGEVGPSLDSEVLLRAARLSALRFDHAVPELCGFRFLDREISHGVRVRVDDFETYVSALATKEKNFVKSIQSSERRLRREVGDFSFAWHTVDAQYDIAQLIRAKRDQYIRTGKPDDFKPPWTRRLLYRLFEEPQRSLCRPVLLTLKCGDIWIASNLGLGCGETLHGWFMVYNTEFSRYGPGHILMLKLIERGCTEGFRWFDLGEGESKYKLRYGGETYRLESGVIRRRSLTGQMERMLQSLQWRVRLVGDSWRKAQAKIGSGRRMAGGGV